ncbi:MAG: hypothetical protein ABSA04_13310 [Desulfobaccales bacterium]
MGNTLGRDPRFSGATLGLTGKNREKTGEAPRPAFPATSPGGKDSPGALGTPTLFPGGVSGRRPRRGATPDLAAGDTRGGARVP